MDPHKIAQKEKSFVTKTGTKLESLKDLYGHLAIITDEEFVHHVNEQKNDFALWIEHAHGDKFLAAAVRQTRTKDGIRKAIFIALFS